MVFAHDTEVSAKSDSRAYFWKNERYSCVWKGLVFVPGVSAGESSIRSFAAAAEQEGVLNAVLRLRGGFFLAIRDRANGLTHTFVDNGGLFKAYHSERLIGTSYLELVRALHLTKRDVSAEAVVEFFHLGYVHEHRTFTPQVEKFRHDEVLTFAADGTLVSIRKPLPSIDHSRGCAPLEFFHDLAESIRHERISVDLTGGFDSRLIACLLWHEGVEFETALSGVPGTKDLNIGALVARELGKDFHATIHRLGEPAEDIPRLFHHVDGLADLLVYHRVAQFNADRLNRGITLAVAGSGGGLYKDYWWGQDFPFYRKKTANLGRLYDLRISTPRFPHSYFAGDMRGLSETFRTRTINKLSSFVGETNTASYDLISYYYKMQESHGTMMTITTNGYFNNYAPLLDHGMASFGFSLPRRERCCSLFMRSLMRQLNSRVAKIPTTEDSSASADPIYLLRDAGLLAWNRGKRIIKKISERATAKAVFLQSPNHPGLRKAVLDSAIMDACFESLKAHGLLNPDLGKEGLRPAHIGRVLTLGFLLNWLE